MKNLSILSLLLVFLCSSCYKEIKAEYENINYKWKVLSSKGLSKTFELEINEIDLRKAEVTNKYLRKKNIYSGAFIIDKGQNVKYTTSYRLLGDSKIEFRYVNDKRPAPEPGVLSSFVPTAESAIFEKDIMGTWILSYSGTTMILKNNDKEMVFNR